MTEDRPTENKLRSLPFQSGGYISVAVTTSLRTTRS